MGYILSKKFTKNQKANIHRTIKRGLDSGKSAIEIKSDLRIKGLGYRDTNLYHDIRRKQASYTRIKENGKITYKSMEPESRRKSQEWFDNVFEKFRKDKKISSKQASKIWQRAKTQSYEKLAESDILEAEEIWEYYEAL